ncbi:twin-arginine translocase TatA/TatE family subunit [Candidatus Poribacteria bacterium]|nr:twin-arginine translocase TatA/TatE family subunit [Candidatus Poribacteria bacterium]MYI94614.1 twin-arginine translocase TatA/TatE family subunit [Candidatus Poribacteria bacterium]
MGGFGPTELLIVLAIVLVLFGAKKLPDLARGIGKSVTSFKSGLQEGADEETEVATQQEKDTTQKEETG